MRILRTWFLPGLLFISLCCFLSIFIAPTSFWPAVFAAYAIPAVIVINILLLILFLIRRKWRQAFYPLAALAFGTPFLLSTFRYNLARDNRKGISVLSFNAKLFRKFGTYDVFAPELMDWVANDSSSIKCIQEFSTNNNWKELDAVTKIEAKGYQSLLFRARMRVNEHNRGMAIFSKFPIINSGIVWDDSVGSNAAMYADIIAAEDTIRIYNVHLASMNLDLQQYKKRADYDEKLEGLAYKLKHGATKRSKQIEELLDHADKSPYPLIICGDFNETPYGFNYSWVKSAFTNTFEECGRGFGFSFNSKMFFLRIDHQFHSEEIKGTKYRVDRTTRTSDHFPTRGYYVIP